MEQVISALAEIKEINIAYELPLEKIEKLENEIAEAKVCTPVIGMFSAGKSRLLNTMLGYKRKILKEDIIPMTAVPAEILYTDGEDRVFIFDKKGSFKKITVDEYRQLETEASEVSKVKIELRNNFLERIPDVMVVDMPGFGSGVQVHDRAIDEYRSNSLAYIVVFPADNMILRSSIGNILRELCLHDMPICVVITKYDKKNDGFVDLLAKLKQDIKRCIGEREVTYCITSSLTNDAEELEDFLEEIQKESQGILANKFKRLTLPIVETTENYLKTVINSGPLTESELAEQKENLEQKASDIKEKVNNKRENFEKEIEQCIKEIKGDLQQALEAEESRIVTMVLNEEKIEEKLKAIVRNTITESIKKRFVPRLEKYISDVNKIIDSERLGDLGAIPFYFDVDSIKNGILTNVLVGVAAFILGPILGGIIAAVYYIWNRSAREKAKKEIERKLRTEVYPHIIKEIENKLRFAIKEKITLINNVIDDDFKKQLEILQKAMKELDQDIANEKLSKEEQINKAQEYLNRVEEIKDVLQ